MEPERLFDCLPNSLRPSGSPVTHGEHHHHNSEAETAVYTPPTLIPPRVLPLLHDLAVQMVQAGQRQQLVKIYR